MFQFVCAQLDWLVQDVCLPGRSPPALSSCILSFLKDDILNFAIFFRRLRQFSEISQSLERVPNRVHVNGGLEGHPAGNHLVNCHFRRQYRLPLLLHNVLHLSLDVVHLLVL